MKNARPWVDMHVGDEFPEQCEAWWNDLQPRNRQPFDRREDVTDWGVLNTAGPCGVMLILLVLTWWRYIRQSEGSWESVVEDVAWVLERMRDCEPVTKGSKGSKKRFVLYIIVLFYLLLISLPHAYGIGTKPLNPANLMPPSQLRQRDPPVNVR